MDLYQILSVPENADSNQIKTAFRKLAKMYHPDTNPKDKEEFSKILKAYEVLINPDLRTRYDNRKKYLNEEDASKIKKRNPVQKQWKFDEKEMRRRQYYDEHIRQYAENTKDFTKEQEKKIRYNEFKYVLYATPVAVILFLLLIGLANREPEKNLQLGKIVPSGNDSMIIETNFKETNDKEN